MPFTIVTLSKVPPSLRGDLTKWMQEIATGVYVGNFNSKIRGELWLRIVDSAKSGEATMSFAARNEIGYDYITHNTESSAIDSDGIPLVMFPAKKQDSSLMNRGFSNASHMAKARFFNSKLPSLDDEAVNVWTDSGIQQIPYAVLDIETDGLDCKFNSIIEIAALKFENNTLSCFSRLVRRDNKIPGAITELTGIDADLLNAEGEKLTDILPEFLDFLGDSDIVGYNINFDISFINCALEGLQMPIIRNKIFDLLKYVKSEKMLLKDYKLQTVIKEYGMNDIVLHRALADAQIIYQLSLKVKKFQNIYFRK